MLYLSDNPVLKKIKTKYQYTLTALLLTVYTISVIYLIPYNTLPTEELFLPIILLVLGFELLTGRIKIGKKTAVIIIALFFVSCFNLSVQKIADFVRITALLLVFNKPQNVRKKYLYFLYIISLIGIIYQLSSYRWEGKIPVLSIGGPNFSGFYTFLFFLFCFKNKYKMGMALSLIASLFYVSRSYYLALASFFILLAIEKYLPTIIEYFKKFGIFKTVVIANVLVLVIGNYMITNLNVVSSGMRDTSRLVTLNDKSNYTRFTTNAKVVEYLTKNPKVLLWGLPEQNEEYILEEAKLEVTTHNAIFWIIAFRGIIFSLLYLLALGIIYKKVYNLQNNKYIFSYLTYTLFLHIGLRGPGVVLFWIVLALPEISFSQKKIPLKI